MNKCICAVLAVVISLLFIHKTVYAKNDISTVRVCDLLNSPAKYNGKLVKLRAKLVLGMHGGALIDAECNASLGAVRLVIPKGSYKDPKILAVIGYVMAHHAHAQVVLIGYFNTVPLDTAAGSFALEAVP